jgi:hypothetical protein
LDHSQEGLSMRSLLTRSALFPRSPESWEGITFSLQVAGGDGRDGTVFDPEVNSGLRSAECQCDANRRRDATRATQLAVSAIYRILTNASKTTHRRLDENSLRRMLLLH